MEQKTTEQMEQGRERGQSRPRSSRARWRYHFKARVLFKLPGNPYGTRSCWRPFVLSAAAKSSPPNTLGRNAALGTR